MYLINHQTGQVIRADDGRIVAPAQSADDPAFVAYQQWVEAGGEPVVIDSVDEATPMRVLSKLEFRRLFTMQERVAIDNAPENAMLPAEVRAAMKTMLTDLALAEQVHIDDADIVYGVNFMAQVGLIAPERAVEILR